MSFPNRKRDLTEANKAVDRIKDYMEKNDIDYIEMSKILRVDKVTVYSWVTGRYFPKDITILKIHRILDKRSGE